MDESKRWIVTYTKHIRQKRKVYQDGFLELHCPSNKVLLYDDSGKLLDSRFLKKDDLVECGVTLAFETHLADIGDLDETHSHPKDFKINAGDGKSNEKAEIYGQNSRYSFLGNKRIELQTSSKVQNHPNTKPATTREWDVLYTSQITQKAKRYHDGILRLVSCGSHTNQLILLKEDGTILSSKFQKSAECLSMGNTYDMPNYLVEICNQQNMQGDAVDKNNVSHNCIQKDSLPNTTRGNMKVEKNSESHCCIQKDSHPNTETDNMKGLENPKNYHPDKEAVIRSSGVSRFAKGEEVLRNKPLHRDVFQILSILRRPPQESLVTRNLLADQASSQSLDLFDSDLEGSGGTSKSVTLPETPSDITKLVYPDCKVELLAVNCSASSSLLHGEEACKTSTNLGIDSTVKDFLDLGASSIVSEASNAASGSSGRTCIKESLGSHAEEKPKLGLYNNRIQIEEQVNIETCGQVHSDDMNSEKEGFGVRSSCASSLGCVTAFPSIDDKDNFSELKTSPGKTTIADEFPSFDLGFEL